MTRCSVFIISKYNIQRTDDVMSDSIGGPMLSDAVLMCNQSYPHPAVDDSHPTLVCCISCSIVFLLCYILCTYVQIYMTVSAFSVTSNLLWPSACTTFILHHPRHSGEPTMLPQIPHSYGGKDTPYLSSVEYLPNCCMESGL